MRDAFESDWSKTGNQFDGHRKHIYGMFSFNISWYCLLFILVQILWDRAWQVVQETLFCFCFSTTAISEDFCYSQCKIQVTVGLTLHDGGHYLIETSPLICFANQWTGFYMITASVMKELILNLYWLRSYEAALR